MKTKILFLLTMLFLSAGIIQGQVSQSDFDVEIKDVGSGLSVKVIKAKPCGFTYTFTVGIYQKFGEVANLWVDGAGWEGQESIGTILAAHPTWNFYGQDARGYCQSFYSTGTRTGDFVNGYYKRYRVFSGGIMVFYNVTLGQEFIIPYNDYQFNYLDANNAAYPIDMGFGAGILTDGAVHEISAVFNGCWDATGKSIAVTKSIQIPSAPYQRYNCTDVVLQATEPAPAPTQKKSTGKPNK